MIGYIIAWNSKTVVNHTTHKALNLVDRGEQVLNRLYTLPNGARVNYDGTGGAALTPGQVVQDIKITGAAVGYEKFREFKELLGDTGTATFRALESVPDVYATAVLMAVTDITPIKITKREQMSIRLTFEFTSLWG